VFVRLRISPPRITQAASNFARRFTGVQGRESPIFVNFAPSEAEKRPADRPAHRCNVSHEVGSACGYRSVSTDVLVLPAELGLAVAGRDEFPGNGPECSLEDRSEMKTSMSVLLIVGPRRMLLCGESR